MVVVVTDQVRSTGHHIVPESRAVFLHYMRRRNVDSSVNTVNLRGFMDEVRMCLSVASQLVRAPFWYSWPSCSSLPGWKWGARINWSHFSCTIRGSLGE